MASQLVYVNGAASVGIASNNVDFITNTFSGSATGPLLGFEADNSLLQNNNFTGGTPYAGIEMYGDGNTIQGASLTNAATGSGVGILVPNIPGPDATTLTINDANIRDFDEALVAAELDTLTLFNLRSSGNNSGGTLSDIGTVDVTTSGGNLAETVDINGQLGTFGVQTRQQPIGFSNVNTLAVDAAGGNDTFNVTPSPTTLIAIDGGAPSFGDPGVPPGDTLNFTALGPATVVGCGVISSTDDNDTPAPGDDVPQQDMTFTDIESVNLLPQGTSDLAFDFNGPSGFTQATTGANPGGAFTPVAPGTLYNAGGTPGTRFGWVGSAPSAFELPAGTVTDPAALANLLRDGHFGSGPSTFRADVADGWYLVTLQLGHASSGRDDVQVFAEGLLVVADSDNPASQADVQAFAVLVEDGALDLTFQDLGGSDPFWVVNGLEIEPANILTLGSTGNDPDPQADGSTDTFNGFRADPNALVTVEAGLDTNNDGVPDAPLLVTSADQSADIAGIQVRADGSGQFSYAIQAPATGGTVLIELTQVGQQQTETGCLSVEYDVSQSRQFDFESPTSSTEPGYTRVTTATTYSASTGLGWSVGDRADYDRGELPPYAGDDLRQDGQFGSGPATFRVDLPNGTYDITVTIDGAAAGRDNVHLSAEGLVLDADIDTPPDVAYINTFTVTVNDGHLDLTIQDLGGSDPFWTLNALTIEPAAPAPLLFAGTAGTGAASLSQAELDAVTVAAISRLAAAGLDVSALEGVTVRIGNLNSQGALGTASGSTVTIDDDGFGYGWFVDATPLEDDEFAGGGDELQAVAASAQGRVDLLTVVMHELAHVLGADHAASGLMSELLGLGTRRLPDLDTVFADLDGLMND